jgi:uncharacterized RDD family membrane protein YckC
LDELVVMENPTLHLAGQGERLINFIVDMIAFLVLWLVLSFGLLMFGLDQTFHDDTEDQRPIILAIILVPTFWGYYILTEFLFQRTLGKLLTKTKVVTKSGGKPTFLQILIRTLSRSIPFEYFSYLGTVNGIHDKLSGTRVIKE